MFGTHPSGTYRGYKATALGAGRETVLAILKDEYKENMTLEETKKLAIKCLVKSPRSQTTTTKNKNRRHSSSHQKDGNAQRRRLWKLIVKELGSSK